MSTHHHEQRVPCAICGNSFPRREVTVGALIRPTVTNEIRKARPDWSPEQFICHADLGVFRGKYVHSLLESEKGEVTSLEQDVLQSLREHEVLSSNVDAELEQEWTLGQRLADKIASFGGSWAFLILFGIFLAVWIAINSLVLFWRPVDPYPFILLNLLLSCIAAMQAPIIMMSQNRQEAKDRVRAQHDYQVNLKAELEIRQLHEKVDHLLLHQWERMVEIQEVQMELLSEIGKAK